jgi:hypothetical protein
VATADRISARNGRSLDGEVGCPKRSVGFLQDSLYGELGLQEQIASDFEATHALFEQFEGTVQIQIGFLQLAGEGL